MLSQDSEDEIRSRFAFELAIRLWQDELNPRVRCAFGNVSFHQPLQKFNSESRSILTEVEISLNIHKIFFYRIKSEGSGGFPYLFHAFICQIFNLYLAK